MTQLELAGKIGNDFLNLVKVYSKGLMTLEEMTQILGKDRTEEVKKYIGSMASIT